jgi:hypothetical protein
VSKPSVLPDKGNFRGDLAESLRLQNRWPAGDRASRSLTLVNEAISVGSTGLFTNRMSHLKGVQNPYQASPWPRCYL